MRSAHARQTADHLFAHLWLCVGDTLDPNAFPKNKTALIAVEEGQRMFDLAHQLLIEMGNAPGIEAYQRLGRNPNASITTSREAR